MCGISGFNWKDEQKIADMVGILSHRGPDANGTYIDENISLGHNRLSIIDLDSRSNQPMFSEDGNLVIIFNGEIYNFKELKQELAGYHFETESDTEVILAGYEKWGKDMVEKLNGMFAFAIWDKRKEELFCARDRAGIKPFYYFWDGKRLIFASEIKAILEHDIPRILDINSFNRYMRILYAPEPYTLIQHIHKLPPSRTLTLKENDVCIESYGQEHVPESLMSYQEAVRQTREHVIQAVERQLVSDVPVGVYLSGGIDSSAILFSMSAFHKNIKTFSVGFELGTGEEKEKFNHDFNLAAKTSQFFGTKHYPVTLSAKDALGCFEKMVAHNDDPVSNPTSIPMFFLSQYAKKEVSVVLSGNGGDELFGGYDRYRMALGARYYKRLPEFVKKILNLHGRLVKLDYTATVDLFARFMFEKDGKLSQVLTPAVFQNDAPSKKFFEEKYFLDEHVDVVKAIMSTDKKSWLPDQALNLGDKMTMAHALEERVPLLDNELVHFAESLPLSHKVNPRRTKKVLKDAFRGDLPDFIFSQPKRGWFSPGAKWLRDPAFETFAREVLSPNYYEGTRQLFEWVEVSKMLEDHISKKVYNLTILWAMLTFQVWARKYKISI